MRKWDEVRIPGALWFWKVREEMWWDGNGGGTVREDDGVRMGGWELFRRAAFDRLLDCQAMRSMVSSLAAMWSRAISAS